MKNKLKVLLSLFTVCSVMSVATACDSLFGTSDSSVSSESAPASESVVSSDESVVESESVADSDTASESTSDTASESTSDTASEESSEPESSSQAAWYTVTFLNDDGTELSSESYEEGSTVVEPETPTKAGDETYNYVFAGWDKEVGVVSGDVTYTATYDAVYVEYTVTFLNDDGSEIAVQTYHYGDEVTAPEANKASTETYYYTFDGWDSEIVAVAGDATYTAKYIENYIEYTITFLNDDGSELSSATYHYGDVVVEPDAPAKATTMVFTFTFDGWDSEVVAVADNATYTAKYSATLASGLKANEVSAAAGESIVLASGSIGGGSNYIQGQQNDDGDDTPSFVHQAYLAIDGNYDMDDYVAFDFTGKNMPEIAFFANNYNDSMYAEETSKQGIVVYTGITTWDGQDAVITQDKASGTYLNYGYPFMIQNASNGGFTRGAFANSALGRANLVDGTHYRVIMGFTKYVENGGIQLNWYLYNLDTNEVVEQSSMATWNFFTGSNAAVNNMTVEDLVGSIVLYGKFGTTLTIDKLHGVYENTTIESLADGLNNNKSYTITFQDENGNELQKDTVAFGKMPVYNGEMPTPEKTEDMFNTYAYGWDKKIVVATEDTVYKMAIVGTPKDNVTMSNVTTNGDSVVLGKGNIGSGANYIIGQNAGGSITQAYLGFDGNYGFDNYLVFDFTGKNMPEVMFFADNYDTSMYYSEGKQGVVVASGITLWDGTIGSAQTNNTKVGVSGPFGAYYEGAAAPRGGNMMSDFAANLARANLVDGTQYRIIMGITKATDTTFSLKYMLYNVTDNVVVEEVTQTSWAFFTGANEAVNNMTLDGFNGSIVLYGKFNATCTIDKLYGIESGAYDDIVAKYAKQL